MLRLRCEVHGAPEYVKNAAVHVVAHLAAEFCVKGFRVPASQFRHVPDSQQVKIGGDGRPDSGDTQQIAYLSDHTASSFPLGSVK